MSTDAVVPDPSPIRRPLRWYAPVLKLLLYLLAVLNPCCLGVTQGIAHVGNTAVDMNSISLPEMTVAYALTALYVFGITLLFIAYVDHRPLTSLGFDVRRFWAHELWTGVGLGFSLPLLIFFISYLIGSTTVVGWISSTPPIRAVETILLSTVLMLSIAVLEETMMRGYVLQTLRSGYGSVAALVISSLIFGSLHWLNPGASLAGFMGTTAAGLVLGYAYLATGRLWFPVGFHLAWNFALGPVFGFPVSGLDLRSIVVQRYSGPAVWTGGQFGPEAGLAGILSLILGALAIRWYAAHRVTSG